MHRQFQVFSGRMHEMAGHHPSNAGSSADIHIVDKAKQWKKTLSQ
jgi:hypothetical protein